MLRAALVAAALAGARAQAPIDASLGEWSNIVTLPLIPVAAAVRDDGQVLFWSAFKPQVYDRRTDRFVSSGGGRGFTVHGIWNPPGNPGGAVKKKFTVSNTGHDMFCPSISTLFDGDIVVSGGQDSERTSVYNRQGDNWVSGPDLNVARGYASSVTLSDGEVFVLGGSWSGIRAELKPAEVYNPSTQQWRVLSGIDPAVILTNDPQGLYRADNYGWFFAWRRKSIFHAGPSKQMNWFSAEGSGQTWSAGMRPGQDSHNGNAVMYDAREGKILTFGGSTAFARPEFGSTADTVMIMLNGVGVGDNPPTKMVGSMKNARVYGNGMVLPDGRIMVVGGSQVPKEFSDATPVFAAEIYDPATEAWTELAAQHAVPRTYHSTALLLKDGRIFQGGGGLCNCNADHLDAEVFTPPYLFQPNGQLAKRPVMTVNRSMRGLGQVIVVFSDEPLSMVSAIRYGSVTHSTNTDQRRVELCGPNLKACKNLKRRGKFKSRVLLPGNSGIMIRGNWMIFGVNQAGVPSVGVNLLVT